MLRLEVEQMRNLVSQFKIDNKDTLQEPNYLAEMQNRDLQSYERVQASPVKNLYNPGEYKGYQKPVVTLKPSPEKRQSNHHRQEFERLIDNKFNDLQNENQSENNSQRDY